MKKTSQSEQRNVIGQRICQLRQQMKPAVTQEDLAGRLARQGIVMDRSAISRIESRTRYLMDYEILALPRALKTKVARLFDEDCIQG